MTTEDPGAWRRVLAYIRNHSKGVRVRWCTIDAQITPRRSNKIIADLLEAGLVKLDDVVDKIGANTLVYPVGGADGTLVRKRRRWGRRPPRQYQGQWQPDRGEYVLYCRTCNTQEYGGWKTPEQVRDSAVPAHHSFHHPNQPSV